MKNEVDIHFVDNIGGSAEVVLLESLGRRDFLLDVKGVMSEPVRRPEEENTWRDGEYLIKKVYIWNIASVRVSGHELGVTEKMGKKIVQSEENVMTAVVFTLWEEQPRTCTNKNGRLRSAAFEVKLRELNFEILKCNQQIISRICR